ncbi:hypothetical protein A2U01_0088023, partial [Trifolium medium]|nr:hypothetical protein [Trifolium medium]
METEVAQLTVPDSPENDGINKDEINAKIVGDALASLTKAVSQADVTPDAS